MFNYSHFKIFAAIVINGKEADTAEFSQPASKSENKEITEKIESITEDFDGSGSFQPMEDISELRNEPAFDEMFSLLRNFLSPYSEVQEKTNDHLKRSIEDVKKNDTLGLTKYFSSAQQKKGGIKTINCTHVNSSFKHPDYVQIWFMMHLPKKRKDVLQLKNDYNIETWIERFFEQFLHSYDEKEENTEETTAPPTDVIGTHKIVISQNSTENQKTTTDDPDSNETTADFHMMPETDSTFETTQKFLKNIIVHKERLDTKPVNVWNIKDSSERKHKKRSVELKKNNDSVVEPNLLPFVRQYSNFEYNQMRPKRVKREIQFIAVSKTNRPSESKQDPDVDDDDKNIVLLKPEVDEDISLQKEQGKHVEENKHQHISETKQTSYSDKTATKRSSLWLAVTLPTIMCKLLTHAL